MDIYFSSLISVIPNLLIEIGKSKKNITTNDSCNHDCSTIIHNHHTFFAEAKESASEMGADVTTSMLLTVSNYYMRNAHLWPTCLYMLYMKQENPISLAAILKQSTEFDLKCIQ